MASEIRVNTINNRSGLGTITISDTGAVFAGVTTITSLQVTGTLIGVANTDNIRTNTNATFLQNVNVSGAVTSTGMIVTGVTTVAAGSTSVPSISPSGDTNTGIFFPSADTIAFGEGGTEAARIDSSGRFGIGVSPSSWSSGFTPLQVRTASLSCQTGARTIELASNAYNNSGWKYIDTDFATLYYQYNGEHVWATAASGTAGNAATMTERAKIDNSGRLLVGTSSSRNVASSVGSRLQVEHQASAGVHGLSVVDTTDSAQIAFGTNNSGTVCSSGKLLARINFCGNDGTNGLLNSSAWIEAFADATWGSNDVPGRLVFSTTADGASSPTERARITNDGYFKASNNGNYSAIVVTGHQFYQTASEWNTFFVSTSATPYGIYVRYTGAAPNGSSNQFLTCYDNGPTLRAEIRSNGGLANYSANNSNLSDINAKKDISPAADTWDCIKEWEIVNYRYKDQPDDADLNLGVIAQQVAESCPEVITVFEEAKDDQPEKLGVKEQQMYWMAIKALQEAQERIETLETEKTTQQALIDDLITRVAALEAQ